MVLLGDKVGGNLDMTGDGHIGGNKIICEKGFMTGSRPICPLSSHALAHRGNNSYFV